MIEEEPSVQGHLKDEAPVQMVRPEPLKTLIEWQSPIRSFRKPSQELMATLGAIVFLVVVILFFAKEWLFIGAIIALGFLGYILATIPPENIAHKITNRGIITGGMFYRWDVLSRFWFGEKSGQSVLYVETMVRFPARLALFLGEIGKEQISKIIGDYLPLEEPDKTFTDKMSDWLAKAVPLEKTS